MASSNPRYLYWDSCVFLAYVNEEPGRVEVIDTLWDEITDKGNSRIVTSTISLVEVACGSREKKHGKLSQDTEERIDNIWRDPTVLIVETPEIVMRIARKLIRDAIPHGWRLKPYDAVHLATAMWVDKNVNSISEFHTYDDLKKYDAMTGLIINEPHIAQPKLL